MPFVLLLDNDFIRFTLYRPSDEKVYRKKQKNDGAIEEGKTALFPPCPGAKNFKKLLKVVRGGPIPEGTVVDAVGKQARTF
ncbi:histidine kinase [Serratia marcescens]|uniref:Histidine kinase n=1 Tax=Serratia marcescens TaxID=615 RepID=A0AAP8TN37_SERMA|nr:histidine kinase [Serratia marcescens]PNO63497.1 histidine kinase [Serratia marcescens]